MFLRKQKSVVPPRDRLSRGRYTYFVPFIAWFHKDLSDWFDKWPKEYYNYSHNLFKYIYFILGIKLGNNSINNSVISSTDDDSKSISFFTTNDINSV